MHPQSAVEHLARERGYIYPLGMMPRGTAIVVDEPRSTVLNPLLNPETVTPDATRTSPAARVREVLRRLLA